MLVSRLRVIVVAVVAVLAATHLVSVTVAALPPGPATQDLRAGTGYLNPYFTQNWRLFAPSPISDDRSVLFQAAWRDHVGRVQTTEWVDWTEVELDLVRHRIVGGRAGYVTNKLFGPLNDRRGRLSVDQRHALEQGAVTEPADWETLRRTGREAEGAPGRVDAYLTHERAVVELATAVMRSRHPDAELIAVRYQLRRQSVAPWSARGLSREEREAARPEPVERIGAWRPPTDGDAATRDAIADFDRRHR